MQMQLEKIVAYHKALADPTRIRLLVLLAQGECSGVELAEKLHVSPPTVTHHAAKLREAALLQERREKNTVYFSLNDYFLRGHANAVLELIDGARRAERLEEETMENRLDERNARLEQSVLANFFTKDGRLKHVPAQYKKKLIVLKHIVERLEPGRVYPEAELNAMIKEFHDDFATIRREFIMHQFMYRENDKYERNPRELWTKWEDVH